MAPRSSIERLPPDARKALESWLVEFNSGRIQLDEVMTRLEGLLEFNDATAAAPSRSAVHRYGQKFAKISDRIKRTRAFTDAFAAEVGPQVADGKGLQVLLQTFESLAFDMIGKLGDDESFDTKSLMEFARSLKDVASALKTDADRSLKIQQEALKAAAAQVGKLGKELGWSADTARRVREEITGVKLDGG